MSPSRVLRRSARFAVLALACALASCPEGGGYVTAPGLVAIEVTPTNPSIALGTSQALVAVGILPDGSAADMTADVVWESSDPLVATVGQAPGLEGVVAGVVVGSVTITARLEEYRVEGTTTLTVTPALLGSIAVTPTNPAIALGTQQAFAATGTFDDGTTQDLTGSVLWSSSEPPVADVGSDGVATGLAVGAVTVAAEDASSGIQGTTTLTVTPAVLVSLAVSPTDPSIALGTQQAFAATGTYSDGTTQDLTDAVAWSSSDPGVAGVENGAGSEGLATGLAVGAVTVTALHAPSGLDATTSLTVTAAELVSLALTPVDPAIALGTLQAFTATGTYTDASTQDLTDAVTWSSSDPGVATVSNAGGSEGIATSVAVGTTTIDALHASTGIAAATTLTVTPATLVSIAVTPAVPSIALGTDVPLAATGTYTDASTQDLTTTVTWSSSDPGVATVSNAAGSEGLATSVAVGATTVTALDAASGVGGSTPLTVTTAALVSLAVTPADPSLPLGTDQAFAATGTYTDASTQDLTTAVTWSSADPGVATVSNAAGTEGLATSVAVGTTTVTALDAPSGIDGSTSLAVTPAVLASLAVTPQDPTVDAGEDQAFAATGTLTDGGTQDWTAAATWTSSAPGVATVSNAAGTEGLATGVAAGTATITATDVPSGIDDATTLTVSAPVTLRAASSAGAASGLLGLTIATPAGVQDGDVLVASIAVRPSSAAINPPAGWSLVRRVDNASGNANSLAVYVRVAASEPPTRLWSFSASTGSAGGIAAFENVDTASPVDVEDGQATPSGLSHTAPGVTTTVANTMLVSAHAYSSCAAWTPPAGMTETYEQFSLPAANSAGISLVVAHAPWPSASATGPRAATAAADADTGNAHLLALRP